MCSTQTLLKAVFLPFKRFRVLCGICISLSAELLIRCYCRLIAGQKKMKKSEKKI